MMSDDLSVSLSRKDRDALAVIARQRAKLAKADVKDRSARLRADGEAQLATIFRADDDRWAAAVSVARDAVADANAAINAHCDTVGIPQEFRPTLGTYFLGRGENGTASRRAELRKVMNTRIDALEKQAIAEIDRATLDIQTHLIAGGFESTEAHKYLELMPTAETLLPSFDIVSLPEVAQRLLGLGLEGGEG